MLALCPAGQCLQVLADQRVEFLEWILEAGDVVLLGRETIFRNGEIAGWLTSGGWGYTVNKNIGYGYLRNPEGVDSHYINSGTYELEVAAVRHPCKLQLGPLYDPKMERVRK